MKRAILLLASLCLLSVPAASAGPVATDGCDPNNVDVNCVFWAALALLIPEECVEANNFVSCTIIKVLDELPDP